MRLQSLLPFVGIIALQLLLTSSAPVPVSSPRSEVETRSIFPRGGEDDRTDPLFRNLGKKPMTVKERKKIAYDKQKELRAAITAAEAANVQLTEEQWKEKLKWENEKATRNTRHAADKALLTDSPPKPRRPKGSGPRHIESSGDWERKKYLVGEARVAKAQGKLTASQAALLAKADQKLAADRARDERKRKGIAAAKPGQVQAGRLIKAQAALQGNLDAQAARDEAHKAVEQLRIKEAMNLGNLT